MGLIQLGLNVVRRWFLLKKFLVTTAEFIVQLSKEDGILCPLESELTLHEDQFEQH